MNNLLHYFWTMVKYMKNFYEKQMACFRCNMHCCKGCLGYDNFIEEMFDGDVVISGVYSNKDHTLELNEECPILCSECGDLHNNHDDSRCNHCNGVYDAIFDAKWKQYIALERAA